MKTITLSLTDEESEQLIEDLSGADCVDISETAIRLLKIQLTSDEQSYLIQMLKQDKENLHTLVKFMVRDIEDDLGGEPDNSLYEDSNIVDSLLNKLGGGK